MKLSLLFALATLILAPPAARACLWDSDTLAMEKARFPGISEVMTGNFPRHSKAYYEWRVKQCEAALAKDRNQVALYDDLAVAQHKLGDHKTGIATMEAKEKVKPGLYETYSNLGTFYIYTGDLKEAVVWIDKALTINPNAHFGRERYQKWLVEWVQEGKPGIPKITDGLNGEAGAIFGFASYVVAKQQPPGGKLTKAWLNPRLNEAKTGVLGMMRFADFDNPLLQEALGDILASGDFKQSAYNFAYQCFNATVRKGMTEEDLERVREKMKLVFQMSTDLNSSALVEEYKGSLGKGRALNEQVAKDEASWIAAGKDAAAEFNAKYLKHQQQSPAGKKAQAPAVRKPI